MKIKRYAMLFVARTRRTVVSTSSAILCSIRDMRYMSIKNRLEIEQFKKNDSYVKFAHYAQLRRVLHEEMFKLKNSDYSSVKINWEFFGQILDVKSKNSALVTKYKHKSIQSTFCPLRNQRLYF